MKTLTFMGIDASTLECILYKRDTSASPNLFSNYNYLCTIFIPNNEVQTYAKSRISYQIWH